MGRRLAAVMVGMLALPAVAAAQNMSNRDGPLPTPRNETNPQTMQTQSEQPPAVTNPHVVGQQRTQPAPNMTNPMHRAIQNEQPKGAK